MDTGLWHQLIRDVYLPCFEGRISPKPIRDPLTNKLISGPLVVKTDAGPGRLSKEASSLEFHEQMAKKGVHILLSLPNATACTAERISFLKGSNLHAGKAPFVLHRRRCR